MPAALIERPEPGFRHGGPYSEKSPRHGIAGHARGGTQSKAEQSYPCRTPQPGAIFVIGAAHSGKSTFAQYLAEALRPLGGDLLGWKVCETGDLILGRAADVLTGFLSGPGSGWETWMQAHKDKYRYALAAFADSHRDECGDYWVQKALSTGARIVVGVRRECEALARVRRGYADVWILVKRPGAEEPGSFEEKAIVATVPGHHCIDNSASTDDLHRVAKGVARMIHAEFERLRKLRAARR